MQLEMSNTLTITFFPSSNNSSWNLRGTLLPQHCGEKNVGKLVKKNRNFFREQNGRECQKLRNQWHQCQSVQPCVRLPLGTSCHPLLFYCSVLMRFLQLFAKLSKIYSSILWHVCLLPQSLHSFPSIFSAKKVLAGCDLQTHRAMTKRLNGIISPS